MIKVKNNNVYHIPNMTLPWSTDRLLKIIKNECTKYKLPFNRNAYYQTMENNGMIYFGLYAKKYTKVNEMTEYTMSQVLYKFAVSSIINFTYSNELIPLNGVEFRIECTDISTTLFNVLGQMRCNCDYKQKKAIIDSVIDNLSIEYIKSKRYDLDWIRKEFSDDKNIMKYYEYWFLEKVMRDDNPIPRIHQIGEKRQKRWSNIKYKNGGYCLFLPNREKQCLRTIYNDRGNGTREYLQTLDSRGLFFTPDRKDKNSNNNWHNFQQNIKKVTLPKQQIDLQTCERTLSEYFLGVVYPFFDHVEKNYGNLSATIPESSATIPESSATIPGCSATIPGCSATIPGCSATIPGCSATIPGCSATIPGCSATKSTSDDSEKLVASTASYCNNNNSNNNNIMNRHFTQQLQTLPTNELDKLTTEDRPEPQPEDSPDEIDNEDSFWNDLSTYKVKPIQKKVAYYDTETEQEITE